MIAAVRTFVMATSILASPGIVRAEDPTPSPEMKKIAFLVGKFTTKETEISLEGKRSPQPDGEQVGSWMIDGHKIRQVATSKGRTIVEIVYTWDSFKREYHTFGFANGAGMPIETVGRLNGGKLTLAYVPPRYAGIGLGLDIPADDEGPFRVVSLTPGLPAERAGVRIGDLLVAIDGKSMKGISGEGYSAAMRGVQGTPITVTIRRDSKEKSFHMKRVPNTLANRRLIYTKTAAGYTWTQEMRTKSGWHTIWELDCLAVK